MPDHPVTVVCCAEIYDPGWRWLEAPLADTGVKFEFASCVPKNALERKARRFNVGRLRGSLDAVRLARRTGAKAIVAHGPTLAAWCGLFARAAGLKIPIVAHTFNFTELPNPAKRPVFAWALSDVEKFVVFSTVEKQLYSKAFHVPIDRFDVVHWGVRPPEVETPETPFVQGDYVCAIGGNARDYRTLLAAAERLPHVPFVLVVRPESLEGLRVPPNVTVHVNLPFPRTMNVLLHSRFMVLPLTSAQVPCGHVTLVAAMHLGRTFVITDSAGVQDYVKDGENSLTVPPGSPEGLAQATERLWNDRELCRKLGENGRKFAAAECTEERIAAHFRGWLETHGLWARPSVA